MGIIYFVIVIVCFAGVNAQSSSSVICTNSSQTYAALAKYDGSTYYINGNWKAYNTLNGKRYCFVVNQWDYDDAVRMCKAKNYLFAQPTDGSEYFYVFEIDNNPNVMMPGVATMYDGTRIKSNPVSYSQLNKRMSYVTCANASNSSGKYETLKTGNGMTYAILGFWKTYDTPNGQRFTFVVNGSDFNNTLAFCKNRTYSYAQPNDDDYQDWNLFELEHWPNIMMPGISYIFDGLRYRDTPTHYQNISMEMVGVLCVNSTTVNMPLTYHFGAYTIYGYWKTYNTPNGIHYSYVVSQADYDKALGLCKSKNYTYVQPNDVQLQDWHPFEIEGKPDMLMPAVSMIYDGNRSRDVPTNFTSMNKRMAYVLCSNDKVLHENLKSQNGDYTIFGFWKAYHIPGGWAFTFVVNEMDYNTAVQVCKNKGYKFAQPDDSPNTNNWYLFEVEGKPSIFEPGVANIFDGDRVRENPVNYTSVNKPMVDVLCSNNSQRYINLGNNNGAHTIYGFWKEINTGNGRRNTFVITKEDYDRLLKRCTDRNYAYVQPNDHSDYWYVFTLSNNMTQLMPGVVN